MEIVPTLISNSTPRLTSDQKALVERNTRLVEFVIKRFCFCPTGVDDWEDLYQVGCVGLIKAARRYDAWHGAAFSTFAVAWVRGEFRDYKKRAMVGKRIAPKAISLDAMPYNASRIADNGQPIEETALNKMLVSDALSLIRKIDQDGILLSWLNGETQAQIAKRAGITQSCVCNKLARLKKRVCAELLQNRSIWDRG